MPLKARLVNSGNRRCESPWVSTELLPASKRTTYRHPCRDLPRCRRSAEVIDDRQASSMRRPFAQRIHHEVRAPGFTDGLYWPRRQRHRRSPVDLPLSLRRLRTDRLASFVPPHALVIHPMAFLPTLVIRRCRASVIAPVATTFACPACRGLHLPGRLPVAGSGQPRMWTGAALVDG